ncbi:MAG: elongation factor P [Candidatus Magasanikbacteria bacterium CG11_big_fil_rev_8_21_14_0_20_39_34]|uniref:Elongation factor P n=1 Tax=Candidatus Magasanikbacteria bacterium CG11_big_fil_rev_8_21_14_0_20_39_34 TaxID=1974653 RepID=A0A2H0N6D8_9BACT|nr:MAG: elongation factor P [Candidatus Magasanikbacteria bacterium CG11_big_fil_rev_8_21_14_0_20_39_34]
MGDTNDIRKGAVIRHQNDLYVITDFQFVNPGKGSAFYKTKLKSITNGKGVEITYKSGESLDTVRVDKQTVQYLYGDEHMLSFMNKSTYETVDVNRDVMGDDAKYLKEGFDVIGAFHDGNIVAIELPKKIQYTVVVAPPAVKGDTASGNVTKEVELDNGLIAYAPIFIKEGDEILINTESGDYCGRVNE